MLKYEEAIDCLKDYLDCAFENPEVKVFINEMDLEDGYDGEKEELCHEFDEWFEDYNDESSMFPNGRDYDAEDEDGF